MCSMAWSLEPTEQITAIEAIKKNDFAFSLVKY